MWESKFLLPTVLRLSASSLSNKIKYENITSKINYLTNKYMEDFDFFRHKLKENLNCMKLYKQQNENILF